MRDPHIIIGAFIEKRRRDAGQDIQLSAFRTTNGSWVASVHNFLAPGMPITTGSGVSLDAAMQALAQEISRERT